MKQKDRVIVLIFLGIILLSMIFVLMLLFEAAEGEKRKQQLSRDISGVSAFIINDIYNKCGDIMLISEVQQETEQQNQWNLLIGEEFIENNKYLLAKIAKVEAGNQNIRTKTLVIMVVLNRVKSKDFPDSISEVIFQSNGKVYQFSPVMPGGSWWTTEPDEDCYEAVEEALNAKYDFSDGALYFESCEETENWHSKNLTYLYQSQDLRFYK